ncbi:WW domain-binding protein 11 [Nymphon striatum]|nr:WW domain-binding protein 11 [Nymphon striatum]
MDMILRFRDIEEIRFFGNGGANLHIHEIAQGFPEDNQAEFHHGPHGNVNPPKNLVLQSISRLKTSKMGRRSINTTKSGKFMNPTDQARKEARKKELKKNRKQRQMVRAAVLKGKDPNQLMVEMEKIDQMADFETDIENSEKDYLEVIPISNMMLIIQPPLNEKVLKDKRKKFRETFQRILKLYEKEDREQWIELKKLEQDYEKKRNIMIQYFESVKHAEQVKLEEIPLPNLPGEVPNNNASQIPLPDDIPLPTGPVTSQPQSILKKRHFISEQKLHKSGKHPAGVPPGYPPPLSDDEEVEDIVPAKEPETISSKSKKIRFQDEEFNEDEKDESGGPTPLQAKMLAMAGQDINEFLKEMEAVHKQKTEESVEDMEEDKDKNEEQIPSDPASITTPVRSSVQLPPDRLTMPPGIPPRLLPPGPPPGPPPGMPPRMSGPPIRLPPGPPPGLPPRMMRSANMMPHQIVPPPPPMSQPSAMNPNVLSAPPSLISKPTNRQSTVSGKQDIDDKKSSGATIEAKPQLRNLSADVTKFMPTSLRVKREDKTIRRKELMPMPLGLRPEDISPMLSQARHSSSVKGPTRDDAYDQFMKEMKGLL